MVYRFDRFCLDPQARELSREGVPLAMRPKVFALLLLLIEHRDRVVERDTLFERLWADRIVSDATLSSCVKELRNALDDTHRVRRYIRTVHGQGFRFVAPVSVEETAAEGGSATGAISALASITDASASKVDGVACTTRLASAGRPERKGVTALHCAIVDAERITERLEPESWHRLMQALYTCIRDTAERFDGHVTQWLRDGCLVLFGAPMSREDDARRAVLAAEAMQRDCTALCRSQSASFACGVASGLVIVSELPGKSGDHYCVSGTPACTASALCAVAGAGNIAISDSTYRLVRGDVRVQPFGCPFDASHENAGALRATVQDAWLVRRIITTSAGVPRPNRRTRTPLTGRDRELALLGERLKDARSGAGQAVALTGAAGIGKTRLLDEFRTMLDEAGVPCIVVNCLPQRRHTPDHVLVDCLRALCGIRLGEDDTEIEQRLREAGLGDELDRAALLQLLGRGNDGLVRSLSPWAQRNLCGRALQQLVYHNRILRVLIVEDLHWIDASSAAWLDALVGTMSNQRLLLLASYRTGNTPAWLRCAGVSQIPLAPLSASESRQLVDALSHGILDTPTTARIVARAAGNPFLLSELSLRRDDGGPIPETVQAVLTARIDELTSSDKQVLQSAAVFGLRTRADLLMALCDAEPDAVRAALLRLQGAELLGIEYDTEGEYIAFRHALVQEAAYAMLLDDDRAHLHGCVVQVIDSLAPHQGAAYPEVLAAHCEQAGDRERAVRLWQRAARSASGRCAYVETQHYVERGLALLSADSRYRPSALQSPVTAVSSPSVGSAQLELSLLHSLAHARMATQGYASQQVAKTWRRAEDLCRTLGDEDALFGVQVGLADHALVSGELGQTLSMTRRLARLARRLDSVPMCLRAGAALGELMMYLGRPRSAVRHLEACLMRVEHTDHACDLTQSSVVLAEGQLAWTRWSLGEERRALMHGERAMHAARASRKPFLEVMALAMNAELQRFRRDHRRAEVLARQAVDVADHQRFTYWLSGALVTLGWSEARRGDAVAGLATIERGIALARSTGERLLMPVKLGVRADVQRDRGHTELARRTLDQAFELARRTGGRYCLAELVKIRRTLETSKPIVEPCGDRASHARAVLHDHDRQCRQSRMACPAPTVCPPPTV